MHQRLLENKLLICVVLEGKTLSGGQDAGAASGLPGSGVTGL